MIPEPPPVFTFTGNLLAEHTLEFESWKPGATQRASRESFQVGGKGINVSKMLGRLGVASTALCFVGGAAGAECEASLTQRVASFRAFRTTSPTRRGTVIRAPATAETTFLGPDAPVGAEAVRACAEFLQGQPPGVLALCGSIPGWSGNAFDALRDAVVPWRSRGGLLVADTYGPPLTWLAALPLDLLKVNAAELRGSGLLATGGTAPLRALRTVITDGPRAVWGRDNVSGETFERVPPEIREISPTGSGDVMLACLIQSLFVEGKSLRDAVQYALPFAAANAAHPGVADFPFPAQDF